MKPSWTRMVDLSIAIEAGPPSDPPMMIPKIDCVKNAEGAQHRKHFFPSVIQTND